MMVVRGNSKVLFERAYQAITSNSRALFSRKQKTVQFSEIEGIKLSPRKVTRAGDDKNPSLATMSLELGEISLTLSDKSNMKIATAYWSDKEIRVLGNKVSELIKKPFIVNERGNL